MMVATTSAGGTTATTGAATFLTVSAEVPETARTVGAANTGNGEVPLHWLCAPRFRLMSIARSELGRELRFSESYCFCASGLHGSNAGRLPCSDNHSRAGLDCRASCTRVCMSPETLSARCSRLDFTVRTRCIRVFRLPFLAIASGARPLLRFSFLADAMVPRLRPFHSAD